MMIMDYLITLNKKETNTALIERQFEETRSKYLRDLGKLRKKYAGKFLKLSSEYGVVSCIEN